MFFVVANGNWPLWNEQRPGGPDDGKDIKLRRSGYIMRSRADIAGCTMQPCLQLHSQSKADKPVAQTNPEAALCSRRVPLSTPAAESGTWAHKEIWFMPIVSPQKFAHIGDF